MNTIFNLSRLNKKEKRVPIIRRGNPNFNYEEEMDKTQEKFIERFTNAFNNFQ